jgi:hypothetical protein
MEHLDRYVTQYLPIEVDDVKSHLGNAARRLSSPWWKSLR